MGPAAVVWAVMDKVVDDYGPVVEGIEDDIEEVEVEVFDDDQPAPTHRIYALKREVVEFHRALGPLLGPLDEIERGKYERIPAELRRFFRDVYDHARRADEEVSSQRELLNSVLEANLALASVAQNEVVKRISSYAAIIAVPTFIASIYGMNFDHMPELHWRIGYPLSLVVMAGLVYLLYRYFKRVNWL
jgi:magnesium transporter